ncbi:hypothetical protein DW262_15240 [Segatella copri]|uniref:Uncharacterized protein n=1 Tax=Segatella copri TaxID=165179 RepID=A0A3R6EIK5_9BACT|nr:hypothetical protein DW263_15890 [Segatella copri]RHG31220.1 hypothetical protein DW262_15240 [Segatella copri]RHG61084.1 hypothetical protein DW250_15445 [Segatella copri]
MVVRDGTALLKVDRIIEVLVLELLADDLQISFDFLGGFEEKAYFCGRLQLKNLKGELLWIH